jgi:hypothetical protein
MTRNCAELRMVKRVHSILNTALAGGTDIHTPGDGLARGDDRNIVGQAAVAAALTG